MTLTGASWGGGNLFKLTFSPAVTVASSDQYKLVILDESGGAYSGGNEYLAVGFNYTISDLRPR